MQLHLNQPPYPKLYLHQVFLRLDNLVPYTFKQIHLKLTHDPFRKFRKKIYLSNRQKSL